MAFTLLRDVALTLLSGLFAWFGLPALLGTPVDSAFFLTGVVIAMPLTTVYAMGVMVANKTPYRALQILSVLFYALGTWSLWFGISTWLDLLPLVPSLLLILLWAKRSQAGFVPTVFRGLWLYGFSLVLLRYGLMALLNKQTFVQPIAFWVAIFYFNFRLASELFDSKTAA